MCNMACIAFGTKNLEKAEIKGKRILEIGSKDVNGSLRSVLKKWKPAEYIGVDIEKGKGVDLICGAEAIIEKFGKESFDVVISTELLEHVRNWRLVFSNIKNICKPGGLILITTRSYGFACHGFPHDFWRYELEDMQKIFADCDIQALEKDCMEPGVFIRAKKPIDFREKDLTDYELYSLIANGRSRTIF